MGPNGNRRHGRGAPLVAALALALGLGLLGAAGAGNAAGSVASTRSSKSASKPETHTVTIDATSYRPSTLVVRPGDSIVWVNNDLFRHTVTARAGFDSKDIPAGESWTFKTKSTGRFDYSCVYHTAMTGTLIVR